MIIDMHSHILPGLDDGARDWEEFLHMARKAVEEGVGTMVCTPHFIPGEFEYTEEEYISTLNNAKKLLVSENIPLKLVAGSEVFLTHDVLTLLESGRNLSINWANHYLLIELPRMDLPHYIEDLIFALKLRGITPIIAHPERNLKLANEPYLLKDLIAKGCLCQLNTGSVTGVYGKNTQKVARLFLTQGLIHLLGSDAHSSGSRGPNFKQSLKIINKLIGSKALHNIIELNPMAVLKGLPINSENQVKRYSKTNFIKWIYRGSNA